MKKLIIIFIVIFSIKATENEEMKFDKSTCNSLYSFFNNKLKAMAYSPSNPNEVMLRNQELKQIIKWAELCEKNDILKKSLIVKEQNDKYLSHIQKKIKILSDLGY